MLGRRPRSLLHRTSSKGELHPQSHEIVHQLPSSEDEKPVLQPPHQIVIGFDLGAESSPACESPRSVLEPHHLCFRSQHQPLRSPRSPLSALGSLLSGNGPCTEGAALCLKVAVKAEEAAVDANARQTFSRRGHVASDVDGADPHCTLSKRELNMVDHSNANKCKAVALPKTNYVGVRKNQLWNFGRSYHGSCANPHSKTFLSSECEDEDHDEAANDDADNEDIIDNPVSIFSAASPVLNYFRCDSLAVDFLSKCFLCRRHLLQGKDIYMYRGDQAFCSQECRYQQIVVDERIERYPAAVTCVSGASTHHQRLRKATQAAVA